MRLKVKLQATPQPLVQPEPCPVGSYPRIVEDSVAGAEPGAGMTL